MRYVDRNMKRNTHSGIFAIGLYAVLCLSACQHGGELPRIDIRDAAEIGWEHKSSCNLLYTYRGSEMELSARAKLRGGASSRYNKHSFALELDQAQALAGLPEDDDYVLNANYIDKTMMRHKISYDLFREMDSIRNKAARCAYTEVYCDGEYQGLYVLMQKINAGLLDLDKGDTAAVLFKDPPLFYGENRVIPQDSDNYYQQKYPKIKTDDRTASIESFMKFLFDSDDSSFVREIGKRIDLDNVADWQLLLLFTNNEDGLMKNFYLYRKDKHSPYRIAIWDYDHSFGRDGDNESNMLERLIDCRRCVLLRRLEELPETGYREKLCRRWAQLRQTGIISVKHFDDMVKQNDRIIRRHLDRNFALWPVNGDAYYDDATYEEELERMKTYVRKRIPALDSAFGYTSKSWTSFKN